MSQKGGAIETAVFLDNYGQAVRLPKVVALLEDVKKVEITAISRTGIATLTGESWDSWFNDESVSVGFMDICDRLAIQERELF